MFDRASRSYVFAISGTGLKLRTPADAKASLGLLQPYLVVQVGGLGAGGQACLGVGGRAMGCGDGGRCW